MTCIINVVPRGAGRCSSELTTNPVDTWKKICLIFLNECTMYIPIDIGTIYFCLMIETCNFGIAFIEKDRKPITIILFLKTHAQAMKIVIHRRM